MKAIIKIFLFTIILASCSKNASNDTLLTSTSWALDSASSEEESKTTEVLRFQKDGTYTLTAGVLQVDGKWSWKNDSEIYLVLEGITSDNGPAKFEKTSNYNIKILEISDKSLKMLEKAEGDGWDSGFAKEKIYSAKK